MSRDRCLLMLQAQSGAWFACSLDQLSMHSTRPVSGQVKA